VLVSIAGTLIVRRLISVEVLERHNEVAGFIYAVIGVVYAVLLGFAAITVWERYDRAQAAVEQEADDLGDLYRDAQTFPSDVRAQLEHQIRDYVRLAVQKEWPAMAAGKSSTEVWDAYMLLWRTYYQFSPGTDQEKTWYSQSLTKLNDLSNQRRMRLLTSRVGSVPGMMWVALLGTGIITITFSFLLGTKNALAQIVMSAGLAFTVALVMYPAYVRWLAQRERERDGADNGQTFWRLANDAGISWNDLPREGARLPDPQAERRIAVVKGCPSSEFLGQRADSFKGGSGSSGC
jgi:Na+/melibiose symporter-like transporter